MVQRTGRLKRVRNSEKPVYLCTRAWPKGCMVQTGMAGSAPANSPEDVAALPIPCAEVFFEAFPDDVIPGKVIYIRGIGESFEDAEEDAWQSYQLYKVCPHPRYEKKGTRSGGFCIECGMFRGDINIEGEEEAT